MTSPSSPQSRRRIVALITLAIVAAIVVAFFIFTGLYADVLWYDQVGYLSVLTTQWIAVAVLFCAGFFAMAIPVWVSIDLAYRLRPVYAKLNSQLDRYQQVIEPLRRVAVYGIPALLGLFAGVAAAARWQVVLMFFNRTPTGVPDPQFGLDVSFFLFDLPFFKGIIAFLSAVVLIAGVATIATSYLYGSVRLSGREVRISRPARVQIAIAAGCYIVLQGVSLWFDQYSTVFNQRGLIAGASYSDVNASIPGLIILSGIAVVVAILFFVTAIVGKWRLPVIGSVLLVVSALVLGTLYPWIVQKFQVDPSAKTLEAPYIQRSIDMTRKAYGVENLEEIPYNAKTTAEPGALRSDATTTASIRIMDPALISPTFAQLQQFRQYYRFPANLAVDRYAINGRTEDAVIAARELNQGGLTDAQTWYNNAIVYTHGYGVVAAYGNRRSPDGQPVLMESGIPSTGALGPYEPRIYFGQNSPAYSIVGGPEGTKPVELDYPSGSEGAQQTYTTYSGNGGPKLDNVFKKFVYAVKFGSEQIFLSDAVNSDSQILYDRDPIKRVEKVAPYLTTDSSAYPAVVDGRVKWIVDAYTTSSNYPYSQTQSMASSIADSETPTQPNAVDSVNYVRNSVKATVDAADGTVVLYTWDEHDPILTTWQKVFPGTLKPLSEISSQLMSHVRYPADLFKLQRAVLGQYHVTDAGSFYSREDAWTTPNDPVFGPNKTALQPPYYLTMQMPGQEAPAFSLYSTYIPLAKSDSSRSVLTGYLTADADAGSQAGVRSDNYGKLRLATLPKDDTVPGPGQVQNNFNADPKVSQELNLLRQGQTKVLTGIS